MRNFFNQDLIEILKRMNQINNTLNQPSANTFQQNPYTNTTTDIYYNTSGFAPKQNYEVQTPPFANPQTYTPNNIPTFNQSSLPKYTDILGGFEFPETNRINQLKRNIMSEPWNNMSDNTRMGGIIPENQGFKMYSTINNRQNDFGKNFYNNPNNNQPKPLEIEPEQPFKTEEPKPDVPQEPKPLTLEDRHQKAKEFKGLYSDVSKNLKNIQNSQEYSNGDWQYLDSRFDKDSNYKAVALKNDKTGEISVFNIGTNKWNIKDLKADADMVFNQTPKQFTKAEKFHEELKTQYGDQYKINSIGHTEGGSESQYVVLNNKDINVYTYNAYGIGRNKELKEQVENNPAENIYNYRDSRDPVSKHGKNIGEEYVVKSDDKRFLPFGYFKFHGIDNMGEIDNPTNIEEYKKQNPRFVSDMNNVLLSAEDVGKMDSDTFRFYEPYIDDLLRKKMLMPSFELNRRIANGMNIKYNPAGYYQHL